MRGGHAAWHSGDYEPGESKDYAHGPRLKHSDGTARGKDIINFETEFTWVGVGVLVAPGQLSGLQLQRV